MGTLLIDDPAPTDDLLPFEAISSGWATGTSWDQAWATNPVTSLVHSAQQAATGANALTPEQADPGYRMGGLERIANDQPPPLLTPEQADEKYGIAGQLTFTNGDYKHGVREAEAKLLKGWKQDEIRRSDILARAAPGFAAGAARFGTGMAASVLDPINVASGFIPVLGEARFAILAGKVGLTTARLARGALEGAVGAAAVEPLILLQAHSEQADYDAYDSLLNVTFGTLLGAGLHAGGGFLKDRIVGKPDLSAHLPPAPRISAEIHDTTLRGAVAAVAEDRPVEVTTYLRAATRRDELMGGTSLGRGAGVEPPVRAAGAPEPAPGSLVNPAEEAATRRGQAVEARARELDPETFSHFDRLTQERDTYRRWVGELAQTRRQTAEASVADLDRQITETQERLDGATSQRKAKTYRKRLDEMQAERDSRVNEAVSRDSPDMAKVRQKLQDADIAMRDLAEKVSAAKRQADNEIPDATNQASGLYDVIDPLDQTYAGLTQDPRAPQTFDQAWAQMMGEQRASTPVRRTDTAALSEVDAKAKDYARPATIETESQALADWSSADNETIDAQRQAGNLDEKDEALLQEGSVAEKQHLDRAKGLEALAQCLI